MLKRILLVLAVLFLPALVRAQTAVQIQVHANEPTGTFRPVWAYVGHDEPNYTYSSEGRSLLSQLAASGPYAFHDRTHNLLTTGHGTPALKWGSTNVYTEDAAGRPVYNWRILDRIFDTYRELGITPYVEIGFMPQALSTHPEPYRHHWPNGPLFTGWAYPPKDYNKWFQLIYEWVRHSIERYGRRTVARWDWEVWNEPDIGYWHGAPQEYCKLYDYTAAAVKRALPEARVGGPATTGPASPHAAEFLRAFLTHCVSGRNYATGETGSPLDFISFHAKGRTRFADGRSQMDIRHSFQDIAAGFAIVADYPTLRRLPIIISESDPEGCAACAASLHPENEYHNSSQYAAYEAELLDGTLALAARYHVNLQGAVTWAFTFPGQPWFYGYRSLATHGVDKPVMNIFRMLGLMERQRIAAESSGDSGIDALLKDSARARPDIRAIATRNGSTIGILVWNYGDNSDSVPPAKVNLRISGLPEDAGRVLITHYRIDNDHSNSCTLWKAMGSPQNPSADQIAKFKAAGQLQLLTSPRWFTARSGQVDLSFDLPRQAVSLVRVEWPSGVAWQAGHK
ncbi:MAG TPA: beta-xylosidase [Terriglobia bacterium]|nr:beta-xylosidase [Terriglobia bacterium]